ncbi:MAG: hypothetical protein A3J79_08460 [Elusimicrobia bacterium RIFOXYB2_FULL_62_6]|nr:MAG: hypothetical protein A3J79_08460 [Elusimicrobia bacterium RIFOXYB2_FULL_62_6]
MTAKTLLLAALAAPAFLSAPSAALAAWERIRSSDAPLAVINASTGAYVMNYTAGEGCAAMSPSVGGTDSVWSGYYSVMPFSLPGIGFYGFGSTNGITMEGALWGAKPDDSIKLMFSTEISSTLSRPGLVLTRVLDNSGQEVNEAWAAPTDYSLDYSAENLIVVPAAGWPKGSLFSVYYSSYITDINGYPVSGGTTVYFTVRMDHQTANTATVLSVRNAKVTIPANAYSGDYFLTLSTSAGGTDLTDANSGLTGSPGSPQLLGLLTVNSYDSAGNPAQPGQACVLTIPYRDDNGDGFVEGGLGRIKSSGLSVWRLDQGNDLWVRQAGPSVDGSLKLVNQSVPHFSNYALMGLPDTDLTSAYAYPVPFRPNAGDTAKYGSWATGITFTNLPSYGTIRIYTLGGELVRSLDIASAQVLSQVAWNVKNSDSKQVASGVYIWEITAGKSRKTGKLVVIK